jgi:hypothetical protein
LVSPSERLIRSNNTRQRLARRCNGKAQLNRRQSIRLTPPGNLLTSKLSRYSLHPLWADSRPRRSPSTNYVRVSRPSRSPSEAPGRCWVSDPGPRACAASPLSCGAACYRVSTQELGTLGSGWGRKPTLSHLGAWCGRFTT